MVRVLGQSRAFNEAPRPPTSSTATCVQGLFVEHTVAKALEGFREAGTQGLAVAREH